MTKTALPTERFAVPAAGIGRLARDGDVKANGAAGVDDEAAFPKLLAKMAEAGNDRPSTLLQPRERMVCPVADWRQDEQDDQIVCADDQPHGFAAALPDDETDATDTAAQPVAMQTPAAEGRLPSTNIVAAMMAGGAILADAPSDGPIVPGKRLAPDRDGTDAPERLAAPEDAEPLRLGRPIRIGQRMSGQSAGPEPAGPLPKITVLRQETHLAPVPAQLAHAQAAEAPDVELTPSRRDAKAGSGVGDASSRPRLEGASDLGGDAELPVPPTVATAARGRDLGRSFAQADLGRPAGSSRATSADDRPSKPETFADTEQTTSTVRKETPLLPQLPSSPMEQVADRVARAALANASDARPPEPSSASAKSPSAPLIRVLHIELQPADLGTVTVRMTLKDDVLEVQLDVGRQETARLLQRDRETLSNVLRSAGYQVDAMTVRVAEPDRAPAAPAASQGFLDTSTSSQSGSSQPDARPSGGQPHAEHGLNSNRATRTSQNDESRDQNHLGGDLYV
jgi:chemotaxis protein MotD